MILKSVSVVIPTYNGLELLKKNLPQLIDALRHSGVEWEIIVVDDASTDASVDFLHEKFPCVSVFRNEMNQGFAETINRGISAARHEIVMALNNDVVVEKDLFDKLLPRFADPDVFAVTPNIIDPRNGSNQAIWKLEKQGVCWYSDTCLQLPEIALDREIPLFFSSGGASCFDRNKLLQLGGFDPIYKPFYAEDVDLSYRAWKAGWKCVLEPAAMVWHESSSTIRKYNKRRKIKLLAVKNKIIFLWLNITDNKLILLYVLFFIPSLLWDILSFRKYKFIGTFMALKHLPEIVKARKKRKILFVLKDMEVIEKISIKHKPVQGC